MDINEYVYTRNGLFAAIVAPYDRTLKDCSYGTIVTAIFLSQQMGCIGYNVRIHIAAIATVTLNPI